MEIPIPKKTVIILERDPSSFARQLQLPNSMWYRRNVSPDKHRIVT